MSNIWLISFEEDSWETLDNKYNGVKKLDKYDELWYNSDSKVLDALDYVIQFDEEEYLRKVNGK